jgi:predicted RNA-binding Zn ribbon-like protein
MSIEHLCVTCQDGDVDEFFFVSGRRCLDFLATIEWRRTRQTELLGRPADLDRWVTQSGIVDNMVACTARDLEHAHSVRDLIYRAATAALPGSDEAVSASDYKAINALAGGPTPTVSLSAARTAVHSGTFTEVATVLARETIELIGTRDRDTLKECANPECTRLFIDISRGRNRRWCGMAQCGSRAKSADYRRRRKQQQTPY